MNSLTTFSQLRSLILQQGIVTMCEVQPESDFRRDFHYQTGDLFELATLIEQATGLSLSSEQAIALTTIDETLELLNRMYAVNPQGMPLD